MGFLQTVASKFKRKKAEEMVKKKNDPVRFTVTDGLQPTRQSPGQVFNLRSPVALNIKSKASVKLTLGVSCSYPLHLFEASGMKRRSVRLPDGIWAAHDAEESLVIELRNESDSTQLIERGDTVARAFVMDNSEIEVE